MPNFRINKSSGGSGGAYTSELIWDYVNDNSNTIPYGLYNITLNKSIDEFDAVIILFKSHSSDSGYWNAPCSLYLSVDALKNNPLNPDYFVYTSFDNRSSAFYLSGDTFNKLQDNLSDINGLIAVYGIKY